jgi:MATE family multidrug resistance protein
MTAIEQQTAAAEGLPVPATSWMAELRELFVLAWPLVLAQLAQNLLFTTDVLLMGWLGPQYLAAGMLSHAFFFGIQLFGIGIVGAVAPLVSQALGARDIKAVRRIVQAGFWAGIIFAIIVVPIVWQVRPIMLALGQDPTSAALSEEFLHYAVWLIFPALAIIVVRSFLSAHGATQVILLITLAGVAVNAVGNYALMFGNWGFPRLELRGSGITTTIVNIVMLALMVAYMLGHRRLRRYHVFARFFAIDWSRMWQMVRVGVPIGLMLLVEVALFSTAAFLMGWLGTDEVAAHAVALQIVSMAFMVPLGLSQATTVRVGLAYGRGDTEGIRKAGWTALGLTVVFETVTCILFVTIPGVLIPIFLDPDVEANRTAVALATQYLLIAGVFQLFDGSQATAGAALRGLTDTMWPLIIAFTGYWCIGMPVSVLLGFHFGWRGEGIWWGLAAGLAAVAVVLTIRFAMRERLGLLGPRA